MSFHLDGSRAPGVVSVAGVHPMKPGIDKEMEAFRAALRSRGLAATRQRVAIAETVFSTHGHLTADQFVERVRRRNSRVGRVTVYRNLKILVDAGLVEERPFRKDRMLYEHVVGHHHHDHMVCVRCGKVLEWESRRIEEEQQAAARKRGFRVLHHSHTLFGYCRRCEGSSEARAGASGRSRRAK